MLVPHQHLRANKWDTRILNFIYIYI